VASRACGGVDRRWGPDVSSTVRIVAGMLLIAHGLVHLLYLTPEADDERYPFTLRESSLVPERARRPVAIGLISATILFFTLLGLAVLGVPGLGAWPALGLVAALSSLASLIAFWDTRLMVGVIIDLGVLAVALTRPGWSDAL
jgi:hypothetical protein